MFIKNAGVNAGMQCNFHELNFPFHRISKHGAFLTLGNASEDHASRSMKSLVSVTKVLETCHRTHSAREYAFEVY